MNKISSLLFALATVATSLVLSLPANATDHDSTFTIKITKTIDGKKSEKQETVTLKPGENIDDIVKKMEQEWTKDDMASGKKMKISVEVKSANASGTKGRVVNRDESTIEKEDGKTVIREKKVIIHQDEKKE